MAKPTCTLCDLPTPDEPVVDPTVEGQFCCVGCLEVHRALGDLEPAAADRLERAIATRESPRPGGEDAGGTSDGAGDGVGGTAYLAVDGMHCATCEVFLEARAGGIDGVEDAAASYATDMLRVTYDPMVVDEDDLASRLSGTGYAVRTRDGGGRDDQLEGRTGGGSGAGTVTRLLVGAGFGMMAMLWYVLILYPTYLGLTPVVDLGGPDGRFLFAQLWLLTTIVIGYTGYPILRGAYVSVRAGHPNMDLLVAVAALGAYLYSTLAMLIGRTDLYFDVSIAIILVVTAGTVYEGRVKRDAAGLLTDLTAKRIESARRPDGSTVAISAIEPGDRLAVRRGERVPVDGTVVSGVAAVDEALVTGESIPATKEPGDEVLGGTLVTDAPIEIEAGEPVSNTLDRLVELLWSVQSHRPGPQRLADRLSTVFVPLVLLLAVGATIATLLGGGSPREGLLIGLSVVIVSCPCALGLATPIAVAAGVKEAADRGVVVASEAFIESTPDVRTVVLDKTGTLTEGTMAVERVVGDDPERILELAAIVERTSSHPIAEAIVRRATGSSALASSDPRTDGGVAAGSDRERPAGGRATLEDVRRRARGVAATVDGTPILVGHPSLFDDEAWSIPGSLALEVARIRDDGAVPVVVGYDGRTIGAIAVSDAPRAAWREVVDDLARDGREVIVLTGDDSRAVEAFREHPSVAEVFAGVPPEAKAETIERLRSRGPTAMVGDGSNDAPALATADVGIAIEEGAALASEAADAIVVGGDLRAIPWVFHVAGITHRRIRQNLAWAFAYNLVAIPLAVAGLLTPLFAALAMATSSALVVVNSSRSFER